METEEQNEILLQDLYDLDALIISNIGKVEEDDETNEDSCCR